VTTYQKVPLKDKIKNDLVEELQNLGFITSDEGSSLAVTLLDWNFDVYNNGRFWYEIRVDVIDRAGKRVASNTLKEKIVIRGSVLTGGKAAFEREMPRHYDGIIDKIVRSNKVILEALKI